jgi:hypothetical protein
MIKVANEVNHRAAIEQEPDFYQMIKQIRNQLSLYYIYKTMR